MLQPTIESLKNLRLFGMAKALEEQHGNPDLQNMDFEDRLGFLVDRERLDQDNRKLSIRLRRAKLGQTAAVEDIDFHTSRGLDKSLLTSLNSCAWVTSKINILITGPTGVGKSYLACALGQKACREGFSVLYHRTTRLFCELSMSRGDGRYLRLLKLLAQTDILVMDDWSISPLNEENRRDMLEILEERHGKKSTILTSQLPIDSWHTHINSPTYADAIMDRLVHNAYKINLKGGSMRKNLTKTLNLK
ncbi:MAG: IstB ATP binding protein [uncultured bacterium]|nr:MAG: IstB ATP binding protein [uncultured bacterium]